MIAPYDARQITNWFVIRARQDQKLLGVTTVLKLCYIAHGWHLELLGGPLFENRIEAWRIGPIILDVNDAFCEQGVNVTKLARVRVKPFDSELSRTCALSRKGIQYGAVGKPDHAENCELNASHLRQITVNKRPNLT